MDICVYGISMSVSHSIVWAFVEILLFYASTTTDFHQYCDSPDKYLYSLLEESNLPTNLHHSELVFVSSRVSCDFIFTD